MGPLFGIWSPFASYLSGLAEGGTIVCKPKPGQLNWPGESAWNVLNSSVSGQLQAVFPPGAVCHPDWPQYNKDRCTVVAEQWSNSTFHSSNPVSPQYNDETCLPNASYPCSGLGYSTYVIPVTEPEQVQHAIRFVRANNVRLVIKASGHDHPGRSSGAYSLSIFTRFLRGIFLQRRDPRAMALGGVASLKIYAGELMGDIYTFAGANNFTVVGGADPDVGIAGWIAGGGHGPLTAKYGMGADQVIEMEVVTADGELRVINETNAPDLFWALRGGGSGTFAMLISVTVKVYPATPFTLYDFTWDTAPNSDTFWSLNSWFHSQIPYLAEAGVMGYYRNGAIWDYDTFNASRVGKILGILLSPDLSRSDFELIFQPIQQYVQNKSQWNDTIKIQTSIMEYPDFSTWWSLYAEKDDTGTNVRIASRFLDRAALTTDVGKLQTLLRTSSPGPSRLLGHLVSGQKPNRPPLQIAGGSNAVLPSWRKAFVHAVLPRVWGYIDPVNKEFLTHDLRTVGVEALRQLAPDTGSYMSEADPTDPDWKLNHFGENYDALLRVKQKWDPTGVFWCHHCVGSDLWTYIDDNGVTSSVGQSLGQLCLKYAP